jgi:hypothetical protein
MDKFRDAMAAALALLIIFLLSPTAYAFHQGGGEEYCLGCHNVQRSDSSQDPSIGESPSTLPPRVTLKG